MEYTIIREPVILHRPTIYLKATFTGVLTMAQSISNLIGTEYNLDSAIKFAEKSGVYDDFALQRHICHEIEKDIQQRHKLHWPLLPPINGFVDTDLFDSYAITSIEYIPHNQSGIMIALLKFKLY